MPAAVSIRAPLVRTRLAGMDDDRLAALVATGDERAFEALYDRHHGPLLGFCHHLLGARHDAEDALQQTFLRAHRALLARGAPSEVRPWLYAIARNRCRTLLAASRTAPVPEKTVEAVTEPLGAGVEQRADLRALLADVRQLPEDQRSALVLAELADLSHAEIAAVIDVPTAKVKALIHQARTRLIAERDARETPCAEIREQLATARGGVLRRGPLRRHLRQCDACRTYRDAVARQRTALALVLPVLPSAGLKQAILGAATGGGAGTAAGVGGAAAGISGGGGSLAVLTKGVGAKLAIGAALAGGGGGGAVLIERAADGPDATRPVAVRERGPAPVAAIAPLAVPRAGAPDPATAEAPGERSASLGRSRRARPERAKPRSGKGNRKRSSSPASRAKGKRDEPGRRVRSRGNPSRPGVVAPGRVKPRHSPAAPPAGSGATGRAPEPPPGGAVGKSPKAAEPATLTEPAEPVKVKPKAPAVLAPAPVPPRKPAKPAPVAP